MKTKNIKQKVAAKAAKVKGTVARKCGKVCKALIAAFALATLFGCATAEQPISSPSLQAGKSQTQHVTMHQSQVNIFLGVKEATVGPTNDVKLTGSERAELPDISVLAQAQALESSGTETYSPSNTPNNIPTATPTNEVKTPIKLTYGLQADTPSGEAFLSSLTDASVSGLVDYLKGGKATGTMTVTKKDGSTETVTCKDGSCTRSNGDCISCQPCSSGQCSDGNGSL